MFVDQVKLELRAGKGGDGVVAWRREKYLPKGGPTGGNGGFGGCIYCEADPNINSLDHLANQRVLSAENGRCGGPNQQNGRRGKDLVIKVPLGTLVKDAKTQSIIFDMSEEKEKVLLCQGGKGGLGNAFFKTPRNRAPNKCTPGKFGETQSFELELKLIADVGLVGFPNAGKSTLLTAVANIDAKAGSYPFTTLSPNISYMEFDDFSRIYIADIPGIIEKAHLNKGLGLAFLKHIERCNTLLYVIDLSTEEREDPLQDFLTLRDELGKYSKKLLEKPFIVALNKIDKESSTSTLEMFRSNYAFEGSSLYPISAKEQSNLSSLKEALKTIAQRDGKKYR